MCNNRFECFKSGPSVRHRTGSLVRPGRGAQRGQVLEVDLDETLHFPQKKSDLRYDHSCKATEIRGDAAVIVMGGWNKDGFLNTSEVRGQKTEIFLRG